LKSELEISLALTLKIDVDAFVAVNRKGLDYNVIMENWRRFLVSLLHPNLTKLSVPSSFCMMEGNNLELLKLLNEVGAKCSGLQHFEAKKRFLYNQPDVKRDPCLLQAFFLAMPQLLNLRIVRLHFFLCDDSTLQQFGIHGQNIVYVFYNVT
jgi:hypothetical protein